MAAMTYQKTRKKLPDVQNKHFWHFFNFRQNTILDRNNIIFW